MSSEQFAGILRAVLAAAGGYVMGKGWADEATVTAIGGALLTIGTAIWSVRSKRISA